MDKKMVFTGVDHINIRTVDIEESQRFYTEVLGFQFVQERDLRPSAPVTSVFMKKDGLVVELAAGHDMSLYSSEGRTNHIGLTVDNIQEAYQYLHKIGVKITSEIVKVNDYFYCFFFTGPNEEKFEVLEYM